MKIFIIDDDYALAKCLELTIKKYLRTFDTSGQPNQDLEIQIFSDAVEATLALDQTLPDLILLDILPNGPNCFAFLNELSSYTDTARVPVILLSSLEISPQTLRQYNICYTLQKDTMRPEDIGNAIQGALAYAA